MTILSVEVPSSIAGEALSIAGLITDRKNTKGVSKMETLILLNIRR
jgi:hypothetical protein